MENKIIYIEEGDNKINININKDIDIFKKYLLERGFEFGYIKFNEINYPKFSLPFKDKYFFEGFTAYYWLTTRYFKEWRLTKFNSEMAIWITNVGDVNEETISDLLSTCSSHYEDESDIIDRINKKRFF